MGEAVYRGKRILILCTIVNRGKADKVIEYLQGQGVTFNFISLGRGTATSELLDYLGLGETKKEIVLSTIYQEDSNKLLKGIEEEITLRDPGKGIAFTISIGSVCGPRTLRYMQGNHMDFQDEVSIELHPREEEVRDVMETKKYELIMTIINRGFADEVMEAAKGKGATGGTVIYGRGAGIHEAEKFFGISIQPEKEIVMTLVEAEKRRDIMHAITERCGLNTEGRGMSFSLPVDDVMGIVHDNIKEDLI